MKTVKITLSIFLALIISFTLVFASVSADKAPGLDLSAIVEDSPVISDESPSPQDLLDNVTDTFSEHSMVSESWETISGDYIRDVANYLTDEEEEKLEEKAALYAGKHSIPFYVLILENYSDSYLETATQSYYLENHLGFGDESDGIMLSLAMQYREYDFLAKGNANRMLSNQGVLDIEDEFLYLFSEGRWFDGFDAYLDALDYYFTRISNGSIHQGPVEAKPEHDYYSEEKLSLSETRTAVLSGGGVLSGIASLVSVSVMKRKMKTNRLKTDANGYLNGRMVLTSQSDRYTHTTTQRVLIESDAPRSGGGSGGGFSGGHSFGGGGGFSHHSGKF